MSTNILNFMFDFRWWPFSWTNGYSVAKRRVWRYQKSENRRTDNTMVKRKKDKRTNSIFNFMCMFCRSYIIYYIYIIYLSFCSFSFDHCVVVALNIHNIIPINTILAIYIVTYLTCFTTPLISQLSISY
jgi:hypothetical protein